MQGVYEMAWQVFPENSTIDFFVNFTGSADSSYFGIGIGDRMIGADIVFCAFEVNGCTCAFALHDSVRPFDVSHRALEKSTVLVLVKCKIGSYHLVDPEACREL